MGVSSANNEEQESKSKGLAQLWNHGQIAVLEGEDIIKRESKGNIKRHVVFRKRSCRRRPKRVILMKKRGSRRHGNVRSNRNNNNGVVRRVKTLKSLIPSTDSQGLDGLFRDTADYILSLQMRVRVMQIMVNVLSSPNSED